MEVKGTDGYNYGDFIESNPTSIGNDQGLDYLGVGGGSSSISTETI